MIVTNGYLKYPTYSFVHNKKQKEKTNFGIPMKLFEYILYFKLNANRMPSIGKAIT